MSGLLRLSCVDTPLKFNVRPQNLGIRQTDRGTDDFEWEDISGIRQFQTEQALLFIVALGSRSSATLGVHKMRLIDRILGKKTPEQPSRAPEHAVLVQFAYGSTDLSRLFALEEQLQAAIAAAGVGEFDGNEVATDGSEGILYMYGPDADALFAVVRPALEATDFMRGARVRLRYGPPKDGVREVDVVLGT